MNQHAVITIKEIQMLVPIVKGQKSCENCKKIKMLMESIIKEQISNVIINNKIV